MIPGTDKLFAYGSGLAVATMGVASDNPWLQFGLAGAVVGVVMWQGWKRETRMASRIDLLEDRQDQMIATMHKETAAANERDVVALEQVGAALNDNNKLMRQLIVIHDRHPLGEPSP